MFVARLRLAWLQPTLILCLLWSITGCHLLNKALQRMQSWGKMNGMRRVWMLGDS